jgi:mannose-6-phosphate isomerase-like protein (cupin superfamily)
MVIRPEDVAEEAQDGRPLTLQRVINMEAHGPDLSVTLVSIWGHHDRVVNAISSRAYYIIEGSGVFQVGDGAPMQPVQAGDFVHIPVNVPYEFEGTMRYIVMNGPAFRPGSDVVLPRAFPAP